MISSFGNLISLRRSLLPAALSTVALIASAQPAAQPTTQPATQPTATAPAQAAANDAGKSDTPVRVTQPIPSPLLTDRLFFSEDERTRLDRARARGVTTAELDAGVNFSPTVDGVMRQVGGQTTYWVNGAPRVAPTKGRAPVVPNAMIGPELKAKVVDATTTNTPEAKSPRRTTRDTPRAPSRDNPAR